MVQSAVEFLVPSTWEIEVAVAASAFLIASYWLFAYRYDDAGFDPSRNPADSGDAMFDKDKVLSDFLKFRAFVLFSSGFFWVFNKVS